MMMKVLVSSSLLVSSWTMRADFFHISRCIASAHRVLHIQNHIVIPIALPMRLYRFHFQNQKRAPAIT